MNAEWLVVRSRSLTVVTLVAVAWLGAAWVAGDIILTVRIVSYHGARPVPVFEIALVLLYCASGPALFPRVWPGEAIAVRWMSLRQLALSLLASAILVGSTAALCLTHSSLGLPAAYVLNGVGLIGVSFAWTGFVSPNGAGSVVLTWFFGGVVSQQISPDGAAQWWPLLDPRQSVDGRAWWSLVLVAGVLAQVRLASGGRAAPQSILRTFAD